MEESPVLLERHQGVAVLTLNRPQALNALSRSMRRELVEHLERLNQDPSVRAVVLTGSGRAFSVGQDVREMLEDYQASGPQLGPLVADEYVPMVRALRSLDRPVIALVTGAAAGGGMALALAADIRIISDQASFLPAFIKVGVAPDTGSSFFMTRMLGLSRATYYAITGQTINSETALALGLAQERCPDAASARERALALAHELAQGPTRAYAEIRHLLDRSAGASLADALVDEVAVQTRLGATHDHQEALDAFTSKRPPQFRGE